MAFSSVEQQIKSYFNSLFCFNIYFAEILLMFSVSMMKIRFRFEDFLLLFTCWDFYLYENRTFLSEINKYVLFIHIFINFTFSSTNLNVIGSVCERHFVCCCSAKKTLSRQSQDSSLEIGKFGVNRVQWNIYSVENGGLN